VCVRERERELSRIAVAVDCLDDDLIMCGLSGIGCSNPVNLLVLSMNQSYAVVSRLVEILTV